LNTKFWFESLTLDVGADESRTLEAFIRSVVLGCELDLTGL
jgi:hypothetical protein